MHEQYQRPGPKARTANAMRRALALSVFFHVALALALSVRYRINGKPVEEVVYQVQVMSLPEPAPREKPVEKPAPVPETPKEEPPRPEKEPDKPSEQPPKEEKKAPPKPKETPKKAPPPKPPEKPKPQPKPKKEPQQDAPKPEPQKDPKPEISMKAALPTVLSYWGRNVQRKVERYWLVPSGIRMDGDKNEAVVVFWVNRRGNLLGEPEVVQEAADPALGKSGVHAIQLAAPFPPLPDEYAESQVQVSYVFGVN
ncbi:MAG TPA: hypothetical protein HPP77_11005 [Candidatus Hydrogenedentes bacterium]|nr:hypothetical protein [Candidatus Hydrogenedentota bacterium]HIJ73518.1 hypothetical protein [Candidatus Hydrogenedentota bacterium]